MKEFKICFAGIGSIAKRHINNLRYIAESRGIDIQIDAFRRSGMVAKGIDNIYTELFGKSPNLIIKSRTVEEIKSYTKHIWGWR